jgi:hypothetical protein
MNILSDYSADLCDFIQVYMNRFQLAFNISSSSLLWKTSGNFQMFNVFPMIIWMSAAIKIGRILNQLSIEYVQP